MRFSSIPSDIGEFIHYDPEVGTFTHKVASHRMKAGTTAGSVSVHGYWVLKFRTKRYFAQRVAWFLMTGEQPVAVIDHINGDRLDNRFCNLRAATHSQNMFNARPQVRQLPKGVFTYGGNFAARISAHKVHHWLGVFATVAEAQAAYRAAADKYHGEFARTE